VVLAVAAAAGGELGVGVDGVGEDGLRERGCECDQQRDGEDAAHGMDRV
jgi:hypothetical protein